MLQRVKETIARLRTRSADALPKAAQRNGSRDTTNREPTQLFECQSCGTVYIAHDKQHCTDCEAAVKAVRSQLRETGS